MCRPRSVPGTIPENGALHFQNIDWHLAGQPGYLLDMLDTKEKGQMPTLKETLKRLATTFTVRDIMVPREDLKCEAG